MSETVLRVVDPAAHSRFEALAKICSLDPENQWVGRYAEYEWAHSRHVFEATRLVGRGTSVLELGCNLGATTIVLATLGATVTAVDVEGSHVALARANADRYGVGDTIRFMQVDDTTRLPFADGSFDVITCNSVLEYISHGLLKSVQREADRVLKPCGHIVVLGTSSRLWPREIHSGRWINYLPRHFDQILPRKRDTRRGVFPWHITRGFGRYLNCDRRDRGAAYVEARRRMGVSGARLRLMKIAAPIAARLGLSVGLLTPTISVTLQKADVP